MFHSISLKFVVNARCIKIVELCMYRKNATCDQLLESSAQAVGAASKRDLHTKSSRVSETSTKKNLSSTKESSVKVPDQARLQNKVSVSKPRFGPDNSEILTTDMFYYSSVADSVVDHELMDGTEVQGTGLNAVICRLDNVPSLQVMHRVAFVHRVNLVTDRISGGGNAIASIRPFVSTLSSEPTDRWPCTFACE